MEDVLCVDPAAVDLEFVERLLAARVTEEESRRFASQPVEVVAFTLLVIQAKLGERQTQAGPNRPSSAIPAYEKAPPPPKPKNNRKRGGQPGHPGRSRKKAVDPDRTRRHRLKVCSTCGTVDTGQKT